MPVSVRRLASQGLASSLRRHIAQIGAHCEPGDPFCRPRGRSAELRRTIRRELAQPLVDTLKTWLEAELHRVPPRSPLAHAIRYALVRWKALCLYLEDGRVELHTNAVERAIRPTQESPVRRFRRRRPTRWAIVCSLITTAKLNDRDPYGYLKHFLNRVPNGHPASRLDELLPLELDALHLTRRQDGRLCCRRWPSVQPTGAKASDSLDHLVGSRQQQRGRGDAE